MILAILLRLNALDSCCAFIDSINYILTFNIEYVLNVSSAARDTVDMFIQEYNELDPNAPNIEYKIQTDIFYVRELNRQHNVADYIKKNEFISLQDITTLRDVNNSLGNIINIENL